MAAVVRWASPLMPSDVLPAWTALRAYSIWTSFPLGLNVVSEKSAPLMAEGRRSKGVSSGRARRRAQASAGDERGKGGSAGSLGSRVAV